MSSTLERLKAIWTSLADLRRDPLERLRAILVDTRVRPDVLYPNLAELVRRHGGACRDMTGNELRVFSQNGEDGVIAEALRRIGPTNRTFIEFGIGGGTQGNSVFLADVLGWSGVFLEADPDLYQRLEERYSANDRVQTRNARVTADNINDILTSTELPDSPDILSIDVDGNDYWIWRALDVVRPRLVVIEYNSALDTRCRLVQPYQPFGVWDHSDFFGASLGALTELGHSKGYQLIHTDLTGSNAFFVDATFADRFSDVTPPARRVNYTLQGRRHRRSSRSSAYVTPPTP